MDNMEEKLGSILNNPQMMQQIMTMAQALGQSAPAPEPPPQESAPALDIDPAAIQKMVSLAGQANIDQNQRALLRALGPYLSQSRLQKLEKAMRAAKLAGLASSAISSGALASLLGR